MRLCPVLVLTIACLSPAKGWAQEKMLVPPARLALGAPVASVQPGPVSPAGAAAPAGLARIPDELEARLRAIERRFRDDQRLQRTGAVVGLSAAVFSALRGRQPLAFVGTPALRLGLDKPLTMIRDRSRFVVEPSIGYRSLVITVRRRFD